MKRFALVIFFSFLVFSESFAQKTAEEDYRVYSTFLKQFLEGKKTLKNKKIRFLVIGKYRMPASIIPEFVPHFFSCSESTGQMISDDSIWIDLIRKLNDAPKDTIPLEHLISTDFEIKFVSDDLLDNILGRDNDTGRKWRRFYRKFRASYGIMSFSKIIYNAEKNKMDFINKLYN